MSYPLAESVRNLLVGSLPLVRRHKDELISQMELHLRGVGGPDEPFGQSEVAAMLLTQMLIDQAVAIVDKGKLQVPAGLADEHRALEIVGRHYSRFGDALVPILKDLLGPGVPAEVTGAWCDAFWLAVRALQPEATLAVA